MTRWRPDFLAAGGWGLIAWLLEVKAWFLGQQRCKLWKAPLQTHSHDLLTLERMAESYLLSSRGYMATFGQGVLGLGKSSILQAAAKLLEEQPVACRALCLPCSSWPIVFIKRQAEAYGWHLLIALSPRIDFCHWQFKHFPYGQELQALVRLRDWTKDSCLLTEKYSFVIWIDLTEQDF